MPTLTDQPERILCAAIHWDDGKEYVHQPFNVTTGYVFCGFRHGNCFSPAIVLGVFRKRLRTLWRHPAYPRNWHKSRKEAQGFLTSYNRFVDRHEAWKIAEREGQITNKPTHKGILFSEDLY